MYMAPAPPSDLRPELKALGAFEDVILRCLEKLPQARYDDLAALLVDLEQRLPEPAPGVRARAPALALPGEHPFPEPAQREVAHSRGFRYWPALVIALSFVAGVALVIALRRSSAHRLETASAPVSAAASAPTPPAPTSAPEVTAGSSSESSATASSASSAAGGLQVPARKPTPSGLRPAPTPAPKATGPGAKRRPRGGTAGGEIVDPWAR
jgi:hypothetical protein